MCTIAVWADVDDSRLTVRDWARNPDRRVSATVDRTPEAIREAIEDANLYDPRVNSFNIRPEMTGSVVTLRGKVDNLKAKRAAAANARTTVGVSRVVNRLKVRPDTEQTDEQVEAAVRHALRFDPYVERYEITVNVVDGTAYLSGGVDSHFEKAQAEDVVSRVKGVTDVSNALTVTEVNWSIAHDPYVYDWYVYDYEWYAYEPAFVNRSDQEIEEDIRDEMWWSPFVDSDEVTVAVNDGIATLTGTLDTYAERRSAVENARQGGALAVDNDLLVTVD